MPEPEVKWELVTPVLEEEYVPVYSETHRLRVPGGWLYRETLYREHLKYDDLLHHAVLPHSVALCFVPDSLSRS